MGSFAGEFLNRREQELSQQPARLAASLHSTAAALSPISLSLLRPPSPSLLSARDFASSSSEAAARRAVAARDEEEVLFDEDGEDSAMLTESHGMPQRATAAAAAASAADDDAAAQL